MKRDDKPETALPTGPQPRGPYVDPRVGGANPVANAYAKQLASRKHMPPVGGGPTPPIPHLNQPHQDNRTMSEQAARAAAHAVSDTQMSSIIDQMVPQGRPGPQGVATGLLQTDTLPVEAQQDPSFRQGHGSMYATTQPWLAKRFGVIRNGQHIAPQMLFPPVQGQAQLRPETVAGLQHVMEFQKQAAESGPVPPEPMTGAQKAEDDASRGSAGSAARLGNAPGDSNIKPLTEEERARARKTAEQMDDFDFDNFRQMMMRDILNNEEQRKIVEARCDAMDIADAVLRGYVKQTVPIVPGKFYPEFESTSVEDDLAIKRLLMAEAKTVEVQDRYLLDKFAVMATVIGLSKINGNPLPTHRDEKNNFSDKLFWDKFNFVAKLPMAMVASLGVNYFWFDIRVRKLFVAEQLGFG